MIKPNITIVKVDSDGVGVGYLDGKPVLVPYAIDGEEIELCKVDNMGKYSQCSDYCIVHSSPRRVQPKCQYYGRCGGCQLQHMDYDYQVQLKTRKVLDNLKHIAKVETKCDYFYRATDCYGYRNKMVFVVRDGKCGMYMPHSHNLVEIDNCAIANEAINDFYSVLRDWARGSKPDINHIAIRKVSDKILCVLISKQMVNTDDLVNMLNKKFCDKYQLVININDGIKHLITNRLVKVYGEDIVDDSMQFKYPVSADSFLQVNTDVSSMLYRAVLDEVQGETVINAYSGAGYLTAMLSQKAKSVYGVEIVANAHRDAETMIKNNNINNVVNYCGRAEDIVPQILDGVKGDVTLLVDPPRSGVADSLLKVVNNSQHINKLIYISCDSLSLAKNLRLLDNYNLVTLKLADMFPQTTHVEALAILHRK